MTLDDTELLAMHASPLLVVETREVERIAQRAGDLAALTSALFDYAEICWERGRRFERAHAANTATRWWHR